MKKRGLRLRFFWHRWRAWLAVCLAVSLTIASGGCFSGEEGEAYYGHVKVPLHQEFRWNDGGLPQIFDPALAAAPPDTDVVRAMFEGLTEYDPQSLAPISGVAERWESSPDQREWTFYLRRDARWSNGDSVTAHDFVRSWQRTLRLGDRVPHAKLLENIVGVRQETGGATQVSTTTITTSTLPISPVETTPPASATPNVIHPVERAKTSPVFGAEAVEDFVLRVQLQRPDKNFPALVAHPIFRPIHASSMDEVEAGQPSGTNEHSSHRQTSVISNGAFQLTELASDGVTLERANNYWNAGTVSLERVRFVATRDAESALVAYRAGEVDAVTNANIEPLAVKLLTPYKDFRRATFGALTYYDFNTARAPFNDILVREALSLAVDREKLSADTLEGATEPAKKFLPGPAIETDQSTNATDAQGALEYDVDKARRLLAKAGYPGGFNFPRIKLLINRNEQHRIVAQAIVRMWHNALGIEADIRMLNWDEYEAALSAGDFDVARRSMVMQTTDEETNMLDMFEDVASVTTKTDTSRGAKPENSTLDAAHEAGKPINEKQKTQSVNSSPILTQAQALRELPAMPIYFASSAALVKPYVLGFDSNLLDAPSLQQVRINNDWQPPQFNVSLNPLTSRCSLCRK